MPGPLLFALVLLDGCALLFAGWLASGPGSTFDPSGLPAVLTAAALTALTLGTLAGLLQPSGRLPEILVVSLALLVVIDAAWAVFQLSSSAVNQLDRIWPHQLPLAGVVGVWLGLALAHTWGRYAKRWWRKFALALLAMLFVGLPLCVLDRAAPLWLAAPEEPSSSDVSRADESLLYDERDRLDQALGKLVARTPGNTNVYFIGFAGNGEQWVFSREVSFVREMFERRYAGYGHTVALMNHPGTPDDTPLATATSLHDALMAVGQRMGSDDVLVLFMTSHGSRESGVNVALAPFQFDDITPQMLAQFLEESRIKHRVVIISACYSGIFVEPLRNPETLIITASDATHTSFGCSSEADFTYFGQAYFADALTSTNSLSSAFEKALPIIQVREDKEGFEHSNPQLVMGASIKPVLAQLDATWRARWTRQ